MKKFKTAEEYIAHHPKYSKALSVLRDLIEKTGLKETIKWNLPTYCLDGKNVLSIASFKNHFGIWFFNGVFLKDKYNKLENAQEGKTKAMRQMKFYDINEIQNDIVMTYIEEAIENQKLGKMIKPKRTKVTSVNIPDELNKEFKSDKDLNTAFLALSAYKQKEYAQYIEDAKRQATKESRLKKIIPMILDGVGLNDKYKNC